MNNSLKQGFMVLFILAVMCITVMSVSATNSDTLSDTSNSINSLSESSDISNNLENYNEVKNQINTLNDNNVLSNEEENSSTNVNEENSENVNILTSVSGNNIYISPTGTGTGSSSSDPTNWTTAYTNAVNGSTIIFTSGTYNISKQNIGKDLTLESDIGAQVIFDANNNMGVFFYITDCNVNIIDLTFMNTLPHMGNGGAIAIYNSNATIKNSKFLNNKGNAGGAIAIMNSNVTILNSTFINNTEDIFGCGGAIGIDYGTIDSSISDVTILNSTFINNSAKTYGGAIFNKNGTLININNKFINNTAANGGAIYTGLNNNLTNINTTFINNSADKGGAIYGTDNIDGNATGGYIINLDTKFINNTANVTDQCDGAIYTEAPDPILKNEGFVFIINNGATYINNTYQEKQDDFGTSGYTNATEIYYNCDLALNKTNSTALIPGHNMTYIINVTNINMGYNVKYSYNFSNYPYGTVTLPNDGLPIITENMLPYYYALNCVIKDFLPSDLENVTYSFADLVDVPYDNASNILIGNLSENQSVNLTVKGYLPLNYTNITITNGANVTTVTNETNITNNYDNVTNNVTPIVDLYTNKTVNNTTPEYNDVINWYVTVGNNGPSNATGVLVTETLPEGIIYIKHSASKGKYDPETGIWTVGNLSNGETAILTITTLVNKSNVSITNFANVTGNENDTNLTNNPSNETVTIPTSIDLVITKTVNNSNPNYLDNISWIINVVNNGPSNATGVKVSDLLPKGLIYQNNSVSKGSYDPINNVWNIGNLNVGEEVNLIIYTQVNINNATLINYVNVSANENETNMTNNYANASIIVPVTNSTPGNVTPGNNTPGNNTPINPSPINSNNINNGTTANGSTNNSLASTGVSMKDTGNPILLLLLVLAVLGGIIPYRKQK